MRIGIDKLKNNITKILCFHNVPCNQAELLADCLVTSTACGVVTHGISMLPAYIKKIDANEYNLTPLLSKIKETGAFAVIDSDNAIGAYSAARCMDIAIKGAVQQGMYTVFARNCNTYGPAFYYTRIATEQKLIALTFCNTPPAMAPWGGKKKLLGTNPFAIGIPGDKKGPILFDMATSKVAKSKINKACLNDERIPDNWALDTDGNPTTDPLEAIKGVVLPMAEYKGYGLAMSIDIIAGLLSGAAYLNNVNKFYSDNGEGMNVGQVFIAIDPSVVLNDDFCDDIDSYIDVIHNGEPLSESPILFPGEHKLSVYENALNNGVEITDGDFEMLNNFLSKIN